MGGDYHTDKEFKKLAQKSEGIERANTRGDVDTWGVLFVSGFDKERALSRTAGVFKKTINILRNTSINC